MQIGCRVDLTAGGAAKDQKSEFRSVTAPLFSLSIFWLDDTEFKYQVTNFRSYLSLLKSQVRRKLATARDCKYPTERNKSHSVSLLVCSTRRGLGCVEKTGGQSQGGWSLCVAGLICRIKVP